MEGVDYLAVWLNNTNSLTGKALRVRFREGEDYSLALRNSTQVIFIRLGKYD